MKDCYLSVSMVPMMAEMWGWGVVDDSCNALLLLPPPGHHLKTELSLENMSDNSI
jgi:hypothetical protein